MCALYIIFLPRELLYSYSYGCKKFVLGEKRMKSQNLAFWTKKTKFTFFDEILT